MCGYIGLYRPIKYQEICYCRSVGGAQSLCYTTYQGIVESLVSIPSIYTTISKGPTFINFRGRSNQEKPRNVQAIRPCPCFELAQSVTDYRRKITLKVQIIISLILRQSLDTSNPLIAEKKGTMYLGNLHDKAIVVY